jgi:hypothetical protein
MIEPVVVAMKLVELRIIEQNGTLTLSIISNCSFAKKALLVQWL